MSTTRTYMTLLFWLLTHAMGVRSPLGTGVNNSEEMEMTEGMKVHIATSFVRGFRC